MNDKIYFCTQILILIISLYLISKNNEDKVFSYNLKSTNLESYQSLNLPCISCIPSLWEIEQISGINLAQAKKIEKILKNKNRLNKFEFMRELEKIKGIGKKKSSKIAKLFYF